MKHITDITKGLTLQEVKERQADGRYNGSFSVKTRSIPVIIRDNIFTLFNLVNVILALLVAMTGSYRNMLFMGTIICNVAIGIVQEIRSKRAIDRLTLISAPKAHLRRDGKEVTADVAEVVCDDILLLSSGRQLCADAVLREGSCEVDESLLTGESEPVPKAVGDELLSGSFIVSGTCTAQVTRAGAQSYANRLTSGAKYEKKPHSEMMQSINKIIGTVSVCIVPFALVLFFKAIFITGQDISRGIVSTVAALIGMIPEGLVLLTSLALAVSSVKLARKNTLCQDLYCIENLARVDVLCLDKTGTLTEGCIQVDELIPIDISFDSTGALNALAAVMTDPNPTLAAVKARYGAGTDMKCTSCVPFSSARKWSSAAFDGSGTFVLGAPDFVLDEGKYSLIRDKVSSYTAEGKRVLLLAHSPYTAAGTELPPHLSPKALVVLSDKIRSTARETLDYFAQQGVDIKVISGDDPVTVASVAKRAGVKGSDNYTDASALSDSDIPMAAEKYTVFGRVTPQQKLALIKALRAAGHKVAMTGDGVNDVLALREADCSVAMQSGSEAARNVSQLVLVDSDFSSMPLVVAEGRRCINNIQRSASLFLGKTVFSFLLAVLFLFLPRAYPFQPIQMTLISALTIGIPSFLLTLEPNFRRVEGGFLGNVLRRAFPCGIAVTLGIALLIAAQAVFSIPQENISAMAMLLTAAVCMGSLYLTARPLNMQRRVMLTGLCVIFAGACMLFPEMFCLVPLSAQQWSTLGITCIIALTVLLTAAWISRNITDKHRGVSAPPALRRAAAAVVFALSAVFAVWFGTLMADYISLAHGDAPVIAQQEPDGSYHGLLYDIENGDIEIFGHNVRPSEIAHEQE
ncbi:MAG: cation-translocating P-type ATPase [Oscillospiraceae bacterium]|nr:cation-translocating P-type ATPase [Oscillospiraceae bacterium]